MFVNVLLDLLLGNGADGYLIFKHVQEHNVLYRILFSSQGTTHVRKRVRERIAANKLATCASLQQADEGFFSVAIAANHMAASLLSLIEWWLEHDMPYPPHDMAQIYRRLSKDYESLVTTADAMIYAAMVRLMLRRLAR